MGHSIGDGIVALAIAAIFLGYFYWKYRGKQQRLEVIHKERLVAMDKGIPLPELPIDPPTVPAADQHIPLILGIILLTLGVGTMIALSTIPILDSGITTDTGAGVADNGQLHLGKYWVLPLPFALMGLGLVLYCLLARKR